MQCVAELAHSATAWEASQPNSDVGACAPPAPSIGEAQLSSRWAASRTEVSELVLRVMRAMESLRSGGGSPPGVGALRRSAITAPKSDTEDRSTLVLSGAALDIAQLFSDVDFHSDQPLQTTLMVRNIPGDYTEETLLREWPIELGYDFLFLPRNSKGKANLGYAFVNFPEEAMAKAFCEQWSKARLGEGGPRKRLNISPADVQGLEANIRRLKDTAAQNPKARQCEPVIFRNGRRVAMEDF
eukprot:CAMPEP_0176074946 /NCGR_PEP_ID=MMETSP0120_2-20121206/37457_1 /TAXON_ID=160619 /ORGANISM="Kryptoperidinium foliaceum, Strain CCMP 1326" /LENGTH=241 /DNA_ID=CAMNT_0017408647 /DNA_START=1 /DNA_END=726 /DNA_ORIENTATION=+